MFNLTIRSHKGPYVAEFAKGLFSKLRDISLEKKIFIVDEKVAGLYRADLDKILKSGRTLLIEANEPNKNLDQFVGYYEKLVKLGAKRGDTLVAIGGGVIQDISCFIASNMFRGLQWIFYPTTLLAQADSGIGSKSSINVGSVKNLIGTFTPPNAVQIDPTVLKTLSREEVMSGVGEMLKIHIIDGPSGFSEIAKSYEKMMSDESTMLEFIHRSLLIKKRFIEEDEFDQGIRNVLNYGHSFGHAIEGATEFAIPHGIAVTIGMDLANFTSWKLGLSAENVYRSMHPTLQKNYAGFEKHDVPMAAFFDGLSKDKKNSATQLGLILPNKDGIPFRAHYERNVEFDSICREFLDRERTR